MGNLAQVNNSNFESLVMKAATPVVVDFWAEWCGPCKALGPVLEEIAQEMGQKVNIVKINVDENPELAHRFGIRGIPTMIFFKDGEIRKTLVGNQPKAEILRGINELM